LTQEGDVSDHIIRSGDRVELKNHGRVVIQAVHRDGVRLTLADLRGS